MNELRFNRIIIILMFSFFLIFGFTFAAENELASGISNLSKMVTRPFGVVEAKVAAVDNNLVYLNAGKKQYVETGDVYEIVADGRQFNDPVSRGKLGTLEIHIADIKITTVRDNYSIGQVTNQGAVNPTTTQIKIGQRAIEKAEKIKIAVVRFEYLNSKDIVTPRVAQELMINELIKTGRFIVAEAATTDYVVQQLLTANTSGTNTAPPNNPGSVQFTRNLGKMLGVNYIMYGQLTDLPGFMEMQCRIHDVKTGVGIAAGNVQIVPKVIIPTPTP